MRMVGETCGKHEFHCGNHRRRRISLQLLRALCQVGFTVDQQLPTQDYLQILKLQLQDDSRSIHKIASILYKQ